ncbi:PREDICTED: glycine-rich RNA-binding protein RZ1C isoform X1 [Nelumbo nucifera]|uniref:Glycine-rich RNA-binding protein RZ1C isoform X1 n=2 Tax=Nelumbo nucifera TaxID=4432 RepID=A0A1U7Z6S3_NELNU|nr:PREDICTED: glycine-rich RNA-binding protein RZ1C isoform X1 [Nelumbo nucifera]XP_010243236.1 PREDICTED: glycine-rich RNA-binding protein RZ1C isoform X1 [Nelumbo nucifera]
MAGKEEMRIFVGGLSWETTERQLEDAFSRYGKIIESQIMLDRDTGRPRGFGFVTFADQRGMEDAIREMHGRELGGRVISVNKAQPKMGGDDPGYGYSGGYSSGSRGNRGGGEDRSAGRSDCFKCGRPGHWARECPSAGGGGGGGGGGRFSSRSRFSGGGGRGDRFGGDRYGDRFGGDRYSDRFGGDRYGDRYVDDRYDGGHYGDRERMDSRDSGRYGGRDRYPNDRYPPGGDHFSGDRYGGGSDRYPQNGYGKDRNYDRDAGPRGGSDRYGSGGPARHEGGSYRDRPGPYDRPSRGGRPSSYDRY